MKKKDRARFEKRAATLARKTEKMKAEFVELLKRIPNPQAAVEHLGMGRSTYYDWRKTDNEFAYAVDMALDVGRAFMADVAEAKIFKLVHEGHFQASKFLAQSLHPLYSKRVDNYYDLVPRNTDSIEEMEVVEKRMQKVLYGEEFELFRKQYIKVLVDELKEKYLADEREKEDEKLFKRLKNKPNKNT